MELNYCADYEALGCHEEITIATFYNPDSLKTFSKVSVPQRVMAKNPVRIVAPIPPLARIRGLADHLASG